MTRSRTIAILALLSLSVMTPVLAQDGSQKAAADFKRLVGLWYCDNRTLGEGSHAYKSIWEFKTEFGDRTYVGRWREVRSQEHAQPNNGISLWSYDAKAKRYVLDGLDFGTSRYTWTSDPSEWTDKYPFRYVWSAEGFRLPIHRKDSNEWTFAAEVQDGAKWTTVAEGTCKKQ